MIHCRLIGLPKEAVKRLVHPHSEDKSGVDQAALLILADTLLEFFVVKNDLLLLREFLDRKDDLRRVPHIHDEDAVEKSDEERKREVSRQPLERS